MIIRDVKKFTAIYITIYTIFKNEKNITNLIPNHHLSYSSYSFNI